MLAFVDELVRAGGYESASEVVRDGLRLLEHEKAVEAEKRDILTREIEAGFSDAQAGRFNGRTAADIARAVIRKSGRVS